MGNKELAKLFYELADLLEMQNVEWEPIAYRKAARSIENLSEDIEQLYNEKGIEGLKSIPGIGEGISKKIIQYLETGKIQKLEDLKKAKSKFKFSELMDIEGIGARRAKILYEKLRIRNLEELKEAVRQHKIARLSGFGEKSEKNILLSLENKKSKRYSLKEILPTANEIKSKLGKLKEVIRIEVAGSIRRRKPAVKDIDILVSSKKPKEIIDFFTSMKGIKRILAKGPTRATIELKEGLQADLRVVDDSSYGAALQYFTGSKDFSIMLRQIAMKKGLKLNEYGVFDKKTNKKLAGKTEKEVFKALGLKYVKPELREIK